MGREKQRCKRRREADLEPVKYVVNQTRLSVCPGPLVSTIVKTKSNFWWSDGIPFRHKALELGNDRDRVGLRLIVLERGFDPDDHKAQLTVDHADTFIPAARISGAEFHVDFCLARGNTCQGAL